MAETHKEVVKVWIAPGCIVCDACEADCPEVFDVQEETCVIRPDALKADFTKPLTPSIIIAAEGCPVDVIKYDMIDVEGPEPAAWKEKEAAPAVAGAGGGGGVKKAAVPVYDGPPDPKWASLLRSSHTSGSRSAGGPLVDVRRAKAPAEAIAAALSSSAPPDAVAAAMVGSGFSRPRPSVAERIRAKAEGLGSAMNITRRQFAWSLAIAWGSMAAVGAIAAGGFQTFFVPKVTKEPPSTFRAGRIVDYTEVGVYEQFKGSQGVWIVRLPTSQIVAISDICTHLGCIPNWLPGDQKFKCPCHGSGYYITGVNFEGPAPRPLERYKVSMDGDFILVDKSQKFRQELQQWDLPGAFLAV